MFFLKLGGGLVCFFFGFFDRFGAGDAEFQLVIIHVIGGLIQDRLICSIRRIDSLGAFGHRGSGLRFGDLSAVFTRLGRGGDQV